MREKIAQKVKIKQESPEDCMDRLMRVALGDNEEHHRKVAEDLVSLRHWQQKMNTIIFSNFQGETRSDFEEWKEEKIKSYKRCVNAYECLEYSDYGKNFIRF